VVSEDEVIKVFFFGVILLCLGGCFTCVSLGKSSDAQEAGRQVADLRTSPVVPLSGLAGREGQEVAVRGWPGGVWPTTIAGSTLPGPVLFCETYTQECQTSTDSDEECSNLLWVRSDERPRPIVVLQEGRPALKGEADAASCRVELAGAYVHLERLAEGTDWYLMCLRADQELTVFGRLTAGVIRSGARFVAAPLPPEALIEAEVERGPGRASRHALYFGLAAGVCFLLGVGLLIVAWRSR